MDDPTIVIDVHVETEDEESTPMLFLSSSDEELVAMALRKLADRIHPASSRN